MSNVFEASATLNDNIEPLTHLRCSHIATNLYKAYGQVVMLRGVADGRSINAILEYGDLRQDECPRRVRLLEFCL